MKTIIGFVIAVLFLTGCASVGPVLQWGDLRYYETKDQRLLRVSADGGVYDVSCVGLDWFHAHWMNNLSNRVAACGDQKIGVVNWSDKSQDWQMSQYEVQAVCRPLEQFIDPAPRLLGIPTLSVVPYSCWNRIWEVPFAPVMAVLLYTRLPLFIVYGYLGG